MEQGKGNLGKLKVGSREPEESHEWKTCGKWNGKWVFMRERTDKSLPNSLNTARAVYNSMIYPIDRNVLIDFVEQFCLRNRALKRHGDVQHGGPDIKHSRT
ncbi:mRNA-capping enzyme [Toxocara canis]|uniref:mRNA-capping enzyme n=1 Tax=Toxocara canis TaxID=6265 RepID=A0A0B2UQI9_TOXCA|nr:mRNA-capping enzyme [Toxocara canis]